MTFHDGEQLRAHDLRSDARSEEWPDSPVVTAFRCAMAGFCSGESECWDMGRRSLRERVPPGEEELLFVQFCSFARALLAAAQRPLSCRPAICPKSCLEERLALRMIERAQLSDHAGMLSAASMLLGVDDLGGALQAAQSLASALAKHGLTVRSLKRGDPCGDDLCPHRQLN